MTHALVTGGAGFLGSHLCDALLARGHRVTAADNLVTGCAANVAHLAGNPHFELVIHDVTEPITGLDPVTHVFHFASPASPIDFPTIPVEILKVNSIGTMNALDIARSHGARFLVASTSEVYGDPLVHPQSESYLGNVNPVGVRGAYDEAKRFGEAATMGYRRAYGVNTAIVRIFNTYGPRMRLDDGRVVPNLIGQALRGEPLTVYGDGSQTRSFCYCSDLIDGIVRLAESGEHGPMNIGNPSETTILEFANLIRQLTGTSSQVVFEPLKTADDPKQRRPDITLARERLGWEPTVDIATGLARTIAEFSTRLSV